MQLSWIKCVGDVWCNFLDLNLSHAHFESLQGIYIIWHGGQNPRVVYVGKGKISERLEYHRRRPEILKYSYLGLFVTWASVPSVSQEGVERYLANRFSPLIGERYPESVNEVSVNLPW